MTTFLLLEKDVKGVRFLTLPTRESANGNLVCSIFFFLEVERGTFFVHKTMVLLGPFFMAIETTG